MADSPFPRVAAFSLGLICVATLAAYAGLGWSIARPENQALAGLPQATQAQARQLYSSVRLAPWSSSGYIRLGMFFLANSRPAPAAGWLQRAIVWDARSWQAWYYLGLAERASHKPVPAEADFRKVLSLNPDYVAAKRQLGALMLERRQFADAADAYTALLLRTDADQARVLQGIGLAVFGMGIYPRAERAFYQALARFAPYGDAHSGEAAAFQAQGETQQAAHESRLAHNWREMEPSRTDDPLTEQMESDFPTALSLIRTAVRDRDPRTAVVNMEKALALDPGMVLGWENIIALYGKVHRPKDAERAWNNLARLDPNNVRGRFDLAQALAAAGDRTKAAVFLHQVLAIDPSYAEAHRVLGVDAELDGNREEAARQFRAAFESDPALAQAHVDLGILLLQSGREKEAQAELLRALLPPCYSPEQTFINEITLIKDPAARRAFGQVVRLQAAERKQLGLITILNNPGRPLQSPSLAEIMK
jgi:Tfp pilus assembly protein PilF